MFRLGPMTHRRFMDIFIDVHRITPSKDGKKLRIQYMTYTIPQGTKQKAWLNYPYVLSATVDIKDLKDWRPYVG